MPPHPTSAAFGSLSAPRREPPRSATNSSYNPDDLNSAPNRSLGTRTRTERSESLSSSELSELPTWIPMLEPPFFLASSENSQLYLKWKGAEKTKLLPVLQNSTSIIFFFKAFFFFLSSFQGASVMAVCSLRRSTKASTGWVQPNIQHTRSEKQLSPVSESIMNIQILTGWILF